MLEGTMRAALAKGAISLIPHWGDFVIMGASAAAGANSLKSAFGTADVRKGGVRVQPTPGLITDEDGATASFQVWLTLQPQADVVIDLATSDATEGTPSSSSLVFTPDDWNIPQTVTVTGLDDGIRDGTQSYRVITSPARSTDPAYSGVNPADVSIANRETVLYWSVSGRASAAGRSQGFSGTVAIPRSGGSASFDAGLATITVEVTGSTLSVSGSGFSAGDGDLAGAAAEEAAPSWNRRQGTPPAGR